MSYGKMTAFIDILEKVTTKDAAGFANSSYNTVASVRAYREERNTSAKWERIIGGAVFANVSVMYRFRTVPNLTVTAKHFVSEGGNIYNIVNAEDVRGRGMYVEVLAETAEGSVR